MKMRIDKRVPFQWIKMNRHDSLEIVRTLTREQAWAFMVIEKLVYHTGNRLHDDDKNVAHEMRCDVRIYRRLKKQLVGSGALVVEDGLVTIPHASAAVLEAVAAYTKTSDVRRESAARSKEDRAGSHIKLIRNSAI